MTKKPEWLLTARRRALKVFDALHVEFQGFYSRERLHRLHSYTNSASLVRMWSVCLLTPVPCLVVSLLGEAVPLPPPEAGVFKNWFLFVRSWVLIGLVNATVLVQIGQGAPRLKMSARQVVAITLLAATVSIIFIVAVCRLVVFPFPFGFLVVAPPDVCVVAVCFVYISGPQLGAEPSLWAEIKQQLSVFYCQVALTFVYPLYVYGLVSLSGFAQAGFVLLSPVIQLVAKNWINYSLTDHNDIKPETVVFIVEIFNALYASNALQSVSSWKTTVLVILTDHLQFWIAMIDIRKLLNDVELLMRKIPRSHPVAKENFVQIAERLRNIQAKIAPQPKVHYSASPRHKRPRAWIKLTSVLKTRAFPQPVAAMQLKNEHFTGRNTDTNRVVSHKARVFPIRPPQKNREIRDGFLGVDPYAEPSLDIEALFSRKDRALFIQKASQVLYVTEHIILVEYIEVAMPIIFSIHRLALFHMHNSAYYPFMAELSSTQLYSSVSNVVAYASLELLSLVMTIMALKRSLGFSTFHQLAFVLDKQTRTIQIKLIAYFVYIMQVTILHLGADFSFKFSWVHLSSG